MSLVSEKDRTKDIVNNLSQVKNDIDNALVELGGEKSTSVMDISNRIYATVSENYYKTAEGTAFPKGFSIKVEPTSSNRNQNINVHKNLPLNLSFVPKRLIVRFDGYICQRGGGANYEVHNLVIDSEINKNENSMANGSRWNLPGFYISAFDQTQARVTSYCYVSRDWGIDIWFNGTVKWTALG